MTLLQDALIELIEKEVPHFPSKRYIRGIPDITAKRIYEFILEDRGDRKEIFMSIVDVSVGRNDSMDYILASITRNYDYLLGLGWRTPIVIMEMIAAQNNRLSGGCTAHQEKAILKLEDSCFEKSYRNGIQSSQRVCLYPEFVYEYVNENAENIDSVIAVVKFHDVSHIAHLEALLRGKAPLGSGEL